MKTTLLMSLSALTLSLVATPTIAKEVSQNNRASTSSSSIVEITPFNLVYNGYQGYFIDQGIPGYAVFTSAINTGEVNAKTLVEKAIAKGRLAPETIDDRSYLNSVTDLLDSLEEN